LIALFGCRHGSHATIQTTQTHHTFLWPPLLAEPNTFPYVEIELTGVKSELSHDIDKSLSSRLLYGGELGDNNPNYCTIWARRTQRKPKPTRLRLPSRYAITLRLVTNLRPSRRCRQRRRRPKPIRLMRRFWRRKKPLTKLQLSQVSSVDARDVRVGSFSHSCFHKWIHQIPHGPSDGQIAASGVPHSPRRLPGSPKAKEAEQALAAASKAAEKEHAEAAVPGTPEP